MLKETKLACRITSAAYDMEIAGLIQAAALDLQIAGVLLGGDIEFETDEDTVMDLCTVEDALIIRAIITYVRAHFGSPADYEKLVAAYDTQKAQLMYAGGYTRYDDQ